jgi:hypothetical protein
MAGWDDFEGVGDPMTALSNRLGRRCRKDQRLRQVEAQQPSNSGDAAPRRSPATLMSSSRRGQWTAPVLAKF